MTIDKDQIIVFAGQFDPQPYHLDEEAAHKSVFGGLAASAGIPLRLPCDCSSAANSGRRPVSWEWVLMSCAGHVRLAPGDSLYVETEVLEVRPSKSQADRGLIRVRTPTFNQSGEHMQMYVGNLLVPRRSAAGQMYRPRKGATLQCQKIWYAAKIVSIRISAMIIRSSRNDRSVSIISARAFAVSEMTVSLRVRRSARSLSSYSSSSLA